MMSSCSLRSPTFFRILSSIVSIGIFCAYIIQILDLTESCKGRNLLSSRDNECVSDLKYFTWTDPSDWILRDNIDGYNSWILQDPLYSLCVFFYNFFLPFFKWIRLTPIPVTHKSIGLTAIFIYLFCRCFTYLHCTCILIYSCSFKLFK